MNRWSKQALLMAVGLLMLGASAPAAHAARFCGSSYSFQAICIRFEDQIQTFNCTITADSEDYVCVPDTQQFNINNLNCCSSSFTCEQLINCNLGWSYVSSCIDQCP